MYEIKLNLEEDIEYYKEVNVLYSKIQKLIH